MKKRQSIDYDIENVDFTVLKPELCYFHIDNKITKRLPIILSTCPICGLTCQDSDNGYEMVHALKIEDSGYCKVIKKCSFAEGLDIVKFLNGLDMLRVAEQLNISYQNIKVKIEYLDICLMVRERINLIRK